MLKADEIVFLIEEIGREAVVEESEEFPFRVTKRGSGYHSDAERGALQAKLSMMLEMAARRESKQ